MKKQLNEARGELEDARRKLAKAQDDVNAKEAEVRFICPYLGNVQALLPHARMDIRQVPQSRILVLDKFLQPSISLYMMINSFGLSEA